jgi:hypothetical protein
MNEESRPKEKGLRRTNAQKNPSKVKNYQPDNTAVDILSGVLVTIDGVWIGE